MTASTPHDAILVGGPRDGEPYAAEEAAVVELEIEGLVHRYIRTTKTREHGGHSYPVFNYDGEIDADGAQSGVETR
ncbi:MAG TPA: hypothetical protein VK453_20570 [Micromonosporaceae bacterium]|nr:hypothetical protein [Micromonosporaceae bacterium]